MKTQLLFLDIQWMQGIWQYYFLKLTLLCSRKCSVLTQHFYHFFYIHQSIAFLIIKYNKKFFGIVISFKKLHSLNFQDQINFTVRVAWPKILHQIQFQLNSLSSESNITPRMSRVYRIMRYCHPTLKKKISNGYDFLLKLL